jgi:hypothetical protein
VALVGEEGGERGAQAGAPARNLSGVGGERSIERGDEGVEASRRLDIDIDDAIAIPLKHGPRLLAGRDLGKLRALARASLVAKDIIDQIEAPRLHKRPQEVSRVVEPEKPDHERGVEWVFGTRRATREGAHVAGHKGDSVRDLGASGRGRGLFRERLARVDGDDGAAETPGGGDGNGSLAAREIEDARAGPDPCAFEHGDDTTGGAAQTGHVFEEQIEHGKQGGGRIDGSGDLAAEAALGGACLRLLGRGHGVDPIPRGEARQRLAFAEGRVRLRLEPSRNDSPLQMPPTAPVRAERVDEPESEPRGATEVIEKAACEKAGHERAGAGSFFRKLIPVPHYMALASLDVWLRLLISRRAPVQLAYLPRLAANLFTSYFGTCATLPERLILGPLLFFKFRSRSPRVEHGPGTVVVLGYFRSGTTHLQYLLSCDRRFKTPIWAQSILPHGWIASWTLARFALTPFITNSRPQDDVALGPDWPAEDDFGVSNMSLCSAMPGRFLLPKQYAHYSRYHGLEGLSERELTRWRRTQAALLWKITRLRPNRVLLLKSPSHTARVAELRAMLGENVKFIHITREPNEVVRSNVSMYERLSIYHLQDAPGLDACREDIVREYVRTEEKFLDESADLGPERLCRVRYQDLIADPEGTVRAIYGQLGMELTEDALESMRSYLYRVRAYRTASQKAPRSQKEVTPPDPRLEALAARFDHQAPAIPKVLPGTPKDIGTSERRQRMAWYVAPATAIALAAAWMTSAWLVGNRLDNVIWPVGAVIGWAAIKTAGIGSRKLGILCAILTLLVMVCVSGPNTILAYGWRGRDFWLNIRQSFDDLTTWMYLSFGMVTAYRFASRTQVKPPGL